MADHHVNTIIASIISETFNPADDIIIAEFDDMNARHICYHYLFNTFGFNRYYIIDNQYTAYLRMIRHTITELLSKYDYKTIAMPMAKMHLQNDHFTKYPSIKEIIAFDLTFLPYVLTPTKIVYNKHQQIDDSVEPEYLTMYRRIRSYPTSTIITENYKIMKAFQYCNYYSAVSVELHPWMQYIIQIITNADTLYSMYHDIIELKLMQWPVYQRGYINESCARLQIESQFIIDVCQLCNRGYAFMFDMYSFIAQFLIRYRANTKMFNLSLNTTHTYNMMIAYVPPPDMESNPSTTGELTKSSVTTLDEPAKTASTEDDQQQHSILDDERDKLDTVDIMKPPPIKILNHIITLHTAYYSTQNLTNLLELLHWLYKYQRINELIIEFAVNYDKLREFTRNNCIYIGLHAVADCIYSAVLNNPKYDAFRKRLLHDYYNDIMLLRAIGQDYKFVIQLPIDKRRMIRKYTNIKNTANCMLCLQKYDDVCLRCMSCNKYIGHWECLNKYIAHYKRCPNCKWEGN